MEFYMFILSTRLDYKNIIIYTGYYHASNLVHILEKFYDYNIILKSGTVDNIESLNKEINNCISLKITDLL